MYSVILNSAGIGECLRERRAGDGWGGGGYMCAFETECVCTHAQMYIIVNVR